MRYRATIASSSPALRGMVAGRFLSTPIASRRAFSFAAFSLVASMRRSAAPESQDVDDAAIARRDSDSLTLTGIPACGPIRKSFYVKFLRSETELN